MTRSETRYFRVVNLEKYQHYKHRNPPWIKLHASTLEDYEFGRLQDASKMHLCAIWLLASRTENKIPWDHEWVAKRINATAEVDLGSLQHAGFIELIADASNTLAKCKQSALSETETETETETERETERERERENPAPDRSTTISIFNHWNTFNSLTRHRALTQKAAASINARLKAGYSETDLCRAITRYAEFCQKQTAPGHNHWSLDELMSRGEGAWIDRMLNPMYEGITHETAKTRRSKNNAAVLGTDSEIPRLGSRDP